MRQTKGKGSRYPFCRFLKVTECILRTGGQNGEDQLLKSEGTETQLYCETQAVLPIIRVRPPVIIFAEQGVMCFSRTFLTKDTRESTTGVQSFPWGGCIHRTYLTPSRHPSTCSTPTGGGSGAASGSTSLMLLLSPQLPGLFAPEPASSSPCMAPSVGLVC